MSGLRGVYFSQPGVIHRTTEEAITLSTSTKPVHPGKFLGKVINLYLATRVSGFRKYR